MIYDEIAKLVKIQSLKKCCKRTLDAVNVPTAVHSCGYMPMFRIIFKEFLEKNSSDHHTPILIKTLETVHPINVDETKSSF